MLKSASMDYTTIMPQWLGFRYPTTTCLEKYMAAIDTVSKGIHALYLYVQAKSSNKDPSVINQRLSAFRAICDNYQCSNSSNLLFIGLNGGNTDAFPCDLQDTLYFGVPGEARSVCDHMAKGWRDMVTPYNGFLLSYAATSLLVQSAYESLMTVDLNHWRIL